MSDIHSKLQRSAEDAPSVLGVQAETNPTPVAPDMYDPISNREPGDFIMTPEEPI